MKLIAVLGFVLVAIQEPATPPLPYFDHGACPFECCTYRDWVAEAKHQAVDSYLADGAGRRKPVFTVAKGERVTAMSGVVITRRAGEVRVIRAGTIEVYSSRFPHGPREQIAVAPGDRLFLLTNHGEGYMSGWYKGRLLESFDTAEMGAADGCAKRKGGCLGILERTAEAEWWVKIRNRRGAIGWVLIPKEFGKPSFDRMDSCG